MAAGTRMLSTLRHALMSPGAGVWGGGDRWGRNTPPRPPPPGARRPGPLTITRPAPPAPAPQAPPPPAPKPCVPKALTAPPRYPDSEAALRAAGGAADRYQL